MLRKERFSGRTAMHDQPRMKARDFDPRILEIYDGYVHGKISKREFISQSSRYAAVGMTGAMILDQLQPNYALAQQVAPDDPAIETMIVEYESPIGHGTIRGLMATPAGAAGRLPAVLVIHENRGLNRTSGTWCGGWPRRATSPSGRTA
jgi:carboxymethylenebutenolidase